MKFEVIGREVRKIKDKDASADAGKIVYKELVIIHCINDPARKDSEVVEGRQVQSFTFFSGNGLLKDVKALPIPCVISGSVSRNRQYVNLDDFELLDGSF